MLCSGSMCYNVFVSSRQGEFHPKPLTEPYVIVSHHTALLIQFNTFNWNIQRANGKTDSDIASEPCPTICRLWLDCSYTVCSDILPILPVLYVIYKTLWTSYSLGICQSNESTLEVLDSSDVQCQQYCRIAFLGFPFS